MLACLIKCTYNSTDCMACCCLVRPRRSSDTLSSYSNFGATSVHLAAPGDAIMSTIPGDRTGLLTGTSMATPHVSGAAALVLAAAGPSTLNYIQLRAKLLEAVTPVAALKGKISTGVS